MRSVDTLEYKYIQDSYFVGYTDEHGEHGFFVGDHVEIDLPVRLTISVEALLMRKLSEIPLDDDVYYNIYQITLPVFETIDKINLETARHIAEKAKLQIELFNAISE